MRKTEREVMRMNGEASTGYLRVRVTSAGAAYPVEGAIVLIKDGDAEGGSSGVMYSLRTDTSGLTATVPLPANRETITGNGTPYNVEVIKEGYYRSMINGVLSYDGVSATLPVNLVPVGYGDPPYGASGGRGGTP